MPLTISGAEMRRKATPSSPATALASSVLPHPGGPCKRIPRGGSTPERTHRTGEKGGHDQWRKRKSWDLRLGVAASDLRFEREWGVQGEPGTLATRGWPKSRHHTRTQVSVDFRVSQRVLDELPHVLQHLLDACTTTHRHII